MVEWMEDFLGQSNLTLLMVTHDRYFLDRVCNVILELHRGKLYKHNGKQWIEVNKESTDTFTYNEEYIDHLIEKLGSGEYDPEMLNDMERDQIEARLKDEDK